ncbi:hypothetical protein YK48G_18530 [Lentilactobacillus fungorum]|uniref:Uncharacterized protein n=1 Tax=Lentilactobacillus fungorum TaxID=2201250 RepID=A0ABQ3W0A2_9LACO|nr:hypothetical protein YK48G_18530 [Lentilactobacillus fungorum]
MVRSNDHGIVINFDSGNFLYTTQLAAYEYDKQIQPVKNESMKSNWTVSASLNGNYNITSFYSVNFILTLITALRNSEIVEKSFE